MIELILYSAKYEADTIRRIADFFGYHNSLLQGEMNLTDESYRIAKCTLEEWTEDDSHELYMVQFESIVVAFCTLDIEAAMLLGLKIFISTRNIVQKELRQALFIKQKK